MNVTDPTVFRDWVHRMQRAADRFEQPRIVESRYSIAHVLDRLGPDFMAAQSEVNGFDLEPEVIFSPELAKDIRYLDGSVALRRLALKLLWELIIVHRKFRYLYAREQQLEQQIAHTKRTPCPECPDGALRGMNGDTEVRRDGYEYTRHGVECDKCGYCKTTSTRKKARF